MRLLQYRAFCKLNDLQCCWVYILWNFINTLDYSRGSALYLVLVNGVIQCKDDSWKGVVKLHAELVLNFFLYFLKLNIFRFQVLGPGTPVLPHRQQLLAAQTFVYSTPNIVFRQLVVFKICTFTLKDLMSFLV